MKRVFPHHSFGGRHQPKLIICLQIKAFPDSSGVSGIRHQILQGPSRRALLLIHSSAPSRRSAHNLHTAKIPSQSGESNDRASQRNQLFRECKRAWSDLPALVLFGCQVGRSWFTNGKTREPENSRQHRRRDKPHSNILCLDYSPVSTEMPVGLIMSNSRGSFVVRMDCQACPTIKYDERLFMNERCESRSVVESLVFELFWLLEHGLTSLVIKATTAQTSGRLGQSELGE